MTMESKDPQHEVTEYSNKDEEVLHLQTRDGRPGELNFQLLSDLHLEFYDDELPHNIITPVAPVLALCGDIGYARDDSPEGKKLIDFVRLMSESFEIVLYVGGNHEYWGTSYDDANKWLFQNLDDSFDNVYLMHRRKLIINGVSIIGATLWTNIPVRQSHGTFDGVSSSHQMFWRMADFDNISELSYNESSKDTNNKWPCVEYATYWDREEQLNLERKINKALFCYLSWFERDVEWINQQLDNAQENGEEDIVVLTHHAPTGKGTVAPVDEDDGIGLAYTELSPNFSHPALKLWAFGHTHWNCDIMVNNRVRIVSNSVGYPRDADYRVKSCEGYTPYDPVKSIRVVLEAKGKKPDYDVQDFCCTMYDT